MEQWLDVVKSSIAVATYASYAASVKRIIAPYFRERRITLKELTAKDIQDFYLFKLKSVSASSVIHYHANIHKSLKYAVKLDLIPSNPADKVERPKKDHFVGSFFDADEVNKLFEVSKGTSCSCRFCSVLSTVCAAAKPSVLNGMPLILRTTPLSSGTPLRR